LKRFKFKLETLFELRKAKERDVQNELAALVGIQNRERARQLSLREGIARQTARFREYMQRGDFIAFDAMLIERYVDVSLRAIDLSENKIRAMEPGIQKVRERLVEASRQCKVVEKLKERKLQEYQYAVNRDISKENDDMNQKIYSRRKMKGEEQGHD
jgi:flagellar FliJ protein